MGLLDDLRQQSLDRESHEKNDSANKLNAEEVYRRIIQPKMHNLYMQLDELAKHLNYIKPDIRVSYPFNAKDLVIELKQQDYDVKIDSATATKRVTFVFHCIHNKNIEFSENDPQSFDQHLQFLSKYELQYQCREFKNENHEITGGIFSVKARVPIRFDFTADIENSAINLSYSNFDGLGKRTHSFKAEKLTDDFFDQVGRYIMRENENFMKETISDEARQQIREKMVVEQQQRLAELKEAERLEEEERQKAQESKRGPFHLLKKFNLS